MIRKIREAQKNEEGFTLIELLVVVIIIGILAAIAIPAFLNQRQRGFQAALTSDVRNSAIDVESEFTSNGSFPTALPDTVEKSTDETVLTYSVIDVDGTPAGFCVVGTRPDLPGNVVYDSLEGGVQGYDSTGATECTASTTAT